MRRILMAAIVAGMIGWTTAGRAEDINLVFVNLDKVFSEYGRTKEADAKLKEQADSFTTERKTMIDEFEKLQEEFSEAREEAQNTALSEDARAEKRNKAEDMLVEIRDYENKIRRFDETRRKQLDDQSRRIRKDIVDEIRVVIDAFARKKGYTAVIDSSGQSFNGVELILYVEPKVDITDAIIEEVNNAGDKKTDSK